MFEPIKLLQCNIRLHISDPYLYQVAISITSSSPEERNNVKGNKNADNNKTMSTNTDSSSLITLFMNNAIISSSPVPNPLSTSPPDSDTTVLRYQDIKFTLQVTITLWDNIISIYYRIVSIYIKNCIILYRSSTPDPPITLSLGSWQIKEEDLPLYAGLASGILLLIIVIMSITTWRICHAQRRSTKNRTKRGR